MKTTSTPVFQFSGYPLEWTETIRQKFPAIVPTTVVSKAEDMVIVVPTPAIPETWDESWFASYE